MSSSTKSIAPQFAPWPTARRSAHPRGAGLFVISLFATKLFILLLRAYILTIEPALFERCICCLPETSHARRRESGTIERFWLVFPAILAAGICIVPQPRSMSMLYQPRARPPPRSSPFIHSLARFERATLTRFCLLVSVIDRIMHHYELADFHDSIEPALSPPLGRKVRSDRCCIDAIFWLYQSR